MFKSQKEPILFLLWKRPDLSEKVFDAIRAYKPSKLYLACDGTDLSDPILTSRIHDTRTMILSAIDWDCIVRANFNFQNLGCKNAVSQALNWFFANENHGIILEDDCLPTDQFFEFASMMLEKYQESSRIGCITGVNFQNGLQHGTETYYLSKYNHCWGWASWRRSWQFYDSSIKFWPEYRNTAAWKKMNDYNEDEISYWLNIFDSVYENKIDSWALPWLLSCWKEELLTITPNQNLVSNIGFGRSSTHTKDRFSKFANMKVNYLDLTLDETKGQTVVLEPCIEADRYTFENHFTSNTWISRFKRKVKRLLGIQVDK